MSEDSTLHLQNADLRFIRERLESIDTRLGTLEDKVDQRLQETRPIWESVLQQLKEIDARQGRIENENKDFRRMFRAEFSNLSRVQEDIEERLDKIEGRPLPQ
jgi:DNA repair exonuclease SbcCD ATPase subunit